MISSVNFSIVCWPVWLVWVRGFRHSLLSSDGEGEGEGEGGFKKKPATPPIHILYRKHVFRLSSTDIILFLSGCI